MDCRIPVIFGLLVLGALPVFATSDLRENDIVLCRENNKMGILKRISPAQTLVFGKGETFLCSDLEPVIPKPGMPYRVSIDGSPIAIDPVNMLGVIGNQLARCVQYDFLTGETRFHVYGLGNGPDRSYTSHLFADFDPQIMNNRGESPLLGERIYDSHTGKVYWLLTATETQQAILATHNFGQVQGAALVQGHWVNLRENDGQRYYLIFYDEVPLPHRGQFLRKSATIHLYNESKRKWEPHQIEAIAASARFASVLIFDGSQWFRLIPDQYLLGEAASHAPQAPCSGLIKRGWLRNFFNRSGDS